MAHDVRPTSRLTIFKFGNVFLKIYPKSMRKILPLYPSSMLVISGTIEKCHLNLYRVVNQCTYYHTPTISAREIKFWTTGRYTLATTIELSSTFTHVWKGVCIKRNPNTIRNAVESNNVDN